MGHKPRPKKPDCDCAEKLEEWYMFSLWGFVQCPDDFDQEKAFGACLGYMLRRLSRRQIPRMEIVRDTMTGKVPVPPCGHIGCTWDAEHVH